MPEIQSLYDLFKNDPAEIIGVSVETEKSADPAGYMKRKGYSYPTLPDGSKIIKDDKVAELPSIYLVDKDGIIIHAKHGENRGNFKEDLINRIRRHQAKIFRNYFELHSTNCLWRTLRNL